MDYGRPELADRLAAAYVAGTLRGPARRRFEALLPAHAGLRRATRAWEARLMPLTAALPPQAPPARVWSQIQARLDGLSPSSTSATASSKGSILGRLAFWRGLAAFASVAAIGLAVVLAQPSPVLPPVVVLLSSTGQPAGGAAPASFVASISGDGSVMVTKPIVNVGLVPDRALELWAVPPGGAPRSLGLISATGATVLQRPQALRGANALAVSLEPAGGSPTGAPTGPVLWAGKLTL